MKLLFKELKELVHHMLHEAEGDKPTSKDAKGKDDKKKKKVQEDTGFTCPMHELNLLPFFDRRLNTKTSSPSAEDLAPHKHILPPSGPNPELSVAKQYNTKARIKFYYCPLRENEGPYGPRKVECDYIIIPKQTQQGVEYRAYGEIARQLGQAGVPVKRRLTKAVDDKAIPEAMADELARMEQQQYRWKRIKGAPGTPDQWKKIPAKNSKEYSGDDEHYLSYPYPMALGKANGKAEPAYFFSRDKVARALVALGWHIIEPQTKERPVTRDSNIKKDDVAPTKKGEVPWYDDDDLAADDDDPWDEDTNPDVKDDEDDILPDRWK